ncbi:tRNA epoxyqueuosine(34) reductase QueG, partial [Aquisalimonas sp.]
MSTTRDNTPIDPGLQGLADNIRSWGRALGFQQVGITDTRLDTAEARLDQWLADGRQGDMEWMARHGRKRTRPEQLLPGTQRVISVRMDYHPADTAADGDAILDDATRAFISRYALGRDYHKLMRKRLQQLASRIEAASGSAGYRVFVDSAPVMEKPLAEKAGLGWIGKHTLLLNHQAGSWFFLGELYTDLPLPVDTPGT